MAIWCQRGLLSSSALWLPREAPDDAGGTPCRTALSCQEAAEITLWSLLQFHLRQEALLNLKLQQTAPTEKTGEYFGEGVVDPLFRFLTEKI